MTAHNQPHIGLVTSGTRGDVQPAIVLGKELQAAGYPVTIIAGSNFAEWVESYDLDFVDLGLDIDEVMATQEARAWKNSSKLTELFHMKQLFDILSDTIAASLANILPNYDAIITGGTTFPVAAAVARARDIPLFHLLKQPMYPTKFGKASPMAILPRAESRLNLLTRPLMLRGFWYAYGSSGMQAACKHLNEPEPSYSDFRDIYQNTPTFIAVSPPILPDSLDYPAHVHVTGFLFLDRDPDWTPPPDLVAFLDVGAPPVYIGFGSVTTHSDKDIVAMLVEALNGRRGIIYGDWSDEQTDTVPESAYLLEGAPHDWLFPQMAALVHHGGSGTTAAGLRAGVPAVVVPHFFDQFYFGRRLHELGVGPEPIPRHRLNVRELSDALDTMLTDDSLHTRADAIRQRIQKEDSAGNIVTLVNEYLN